MGIETAADMGLVGYGRVVSAPEPAVSMSEEAFASAGQPVQHRGRANRIARFLHPERHPVQQPVRQFLMASADIVQDMVLRLSSAISDSRCHGRMTPRTGPRTMKMM